MTCCTAFVIAQVSVHMAPPALCVEDRLRATEPHPLSLYNAAQSCHVIGYSRDGCVGVCILEADR